MLHYIKYFFSSLLFLSFLIPTVSFAQTLSTSYGYGTNYKNGAVIEYDANKTYSLSDLGIKGVGKYLIDVVPVVTSSLKIISGPSSDGTVDVELTLPKKYVGSYVVFMVNPVTVPTPISSGTIKEVKYVVNTASQSMRLRLNVSSAHQGFPGNGRGIEWFDLPSGKYQLGAVVYPTSVFKPGTDMEYIDIEKHPTALEILNTDITIKKAERSIKITYTPKDGETFKGNDIIKLTWKSLNIPRTQNFVIKLRSQLVPSKDYVIAKSINDGYETIKIPTGIVGGDYVVIIESVGDIRVTGFSNYLFGVVGWKPTAEEPIQGEACFFSTSVTTGTKCANGLVCSGIIGPNYKTCQPVAQEYCITQGGSWVNGACDTAINQASSLKTIPPSIINTSPQVRGDFISNLSCADISENIHRGAGGDEVRTLQTFLQEQGFLDENPSGFYGDKTVEAVKDYQASKDLPETGMVYDFTRQVIRDDSCVD